MSGRAAAGAAGRRAAAWGSRGIAGVGRLARRAGVLGPRPAVLMYHRVAAEDVDPWGLAVAPNRFEQHLQWLQRTRTVLPLTEFAQRLDGRDLPPDAVAITFDDGYACNATVAVPLLVAHGLPATIFVTTGPVVAAEEFWWDDLQRMVFAADAARLELTVGDEHLCVELGDPAGGAHPWSSGRPATTPRQEAFMTAWRTLRSLEPDDQAAAVAELRSQAGVAAEPRPSHRPMTPDEVRALTNSGLIDVGCHTVTHPALTERSAAVQRAEIEEGRSACAAMTGRVPTSFAYPFGDFDATTVEIVRAAGFEAACTTVSEPARAGCDVLTIPRLQVENWSADQLARALRVL